MTATAEQDYENAVITQLRERGSVSLPAEALAFLLGGVARPPAAGQHPDYLLLWRALLAADPDLARQTWAQSWDQTPINDRIALCVIAAHVQGLDNNQGAS